MKPSQIRRIQALFKLKGKQGVTTYEAWRVCGTTSIHRRMTDLEEEGWQFIRQAVDGERYKRYIGIPPKGWKLA